jgi:hypothetical protein
MGTREGGCRHRARHAEATVDDADRETMHQLVGMRSANASHERAKGSASMRPTSEEEASLARKGFAIAYDVRQE